MMINFTDEKGLTLWVNRNHILLVRVFNNQTEIVLVGAYSQTVMETPSQVIERIAR